MLQWQIGKVKVTRVVESEALWPATRLLPGATPAELAKDADWLAPRFIDDKGNIKLSVHALVLESQGKKIIVDTCIGNDKPRPIPAWSMMRLPFLEDLEKAGFAPTAIDTVICTHLHIDHVGWNTRLVDGRWIPTFPNARYVLARREWEHWSADTHPINQTVLGDSVRPIFDAGLVDLVAADHEVDAAVRLEPTPGHTPGHVSVHVRSRGEEAVITGDLVHHPAQFARPHWGAAVDWDRAMADRTRRAFMERYADAPVLVIGTHFAGPTAGRLVRDGDAYRLDA